MVGGKGRDSHGPTRNVVRWLVRVLQSANPPGVACPSYKLFTGMYTRIPTKEKNAEKNATFCDFLSQKTRHVFNSPTPRVFFAEEWVAGESVTARTTFRPFRASVAVAPFSLGGPQSFHDTSTRTAVGTWRATTRDGGTGCFPAAVRKRQALCDARGQGRGDPPRLSPRCAPEGIPRQRAQS
jgi:hypothetical protein